MFKSAPPFPLLAAPMPPPPVSVRPDRVFVAPAARVKRRFKFALPVMVTPPGRLVAKILTVPVSTISLVSEMVCP